MPNAKVSLFGQESYAKFCRLEPSADLSFVTFRDRIKDVCNHFDRVQAFNAVLLVCLKHKGEEAVSSTAVAVRRLLRTAIGNALACVEMTEV